MVIFCLFYLWYSFLKLDQPHLRSFVYPCNLCKSEFTIVIFHARCLAPQHPLCQRSFFSMYDAIRFFRNCERHEEQILSLCFLNLRFLLVFPIASQQLHKFASPMVILLWLQIWSISPWKYCIVCFSWFYNILQSN